MKKQYKVTGMTCNGCLNTVKNGLLALPEVSTVTIDLPTGETIVEQQTNIPLEILQVATGKYKIVPLEPTPVEPIQKITDNSVEPDSSHFQWSTYQPLFLIVGYILLVSILVQYPFEQFSFMLLMRHFMAGFFLVFSFFKILNISGFVDSYQMYDVVAARWKGWGYVYPFVELTLGILYLVNVFPFYTNLATAIILGISSIGVIQSNLNKQKIKCACLGDVFNLPMSTITIIEDVAMVAMAIAMMIIL